MGPVDLQRYKKHLLEKQGELTSAPGEASARVPSAGAFQGDSIDQANADAEAELQIHLHRSDLRLLRAIQDALARIRDGSYGACTSCGGPISKARLVNRIIKKGDILSLRRELDAGASPNLPNQFSWTLLMLAALEGNTSMGELLISTGADVNATNNFGQTALSLAAHKGHTPFIRALLAHGASTDCRPHGSSLEDWLRSASGLPEDKIASMLKLISRLAPDKRGLPDN